MVKHDSGGVVDSVVESRDSVVESGDSVVVW